MVTAHEDKSLKHIETLQDHFPFSPSATSHGMGWKGIQAVRWRKTPETGELDLPPSSVHAIILMIRPPEKVALHCQGARIEGPIAASSILVFPAGSSKLLRWQGSMDSLGIYIDPTLIARVAAESFDFDPTLTSLGPLSRLTMPELRAAMLALDAELGISGPGSPLLIESLGTMLCVHLLRHVISPHRLPMARDGILSRRKLHNVIDYIMQNLEGTPTLAQMAAIAHLSPYHFARQFKAATGLPPHQYVIARRIERAQHLLRGHDELGLAEVALRAGFSDQSKFSFHFKRLLGVTPRQFSLSSSDDFSRFP